MGINAGGVDALGEECQALPGTDIGFRDTRSFGATLCHVAAEMLGEDPDAEPWKAAAFNSRRGTPSERGLRNSPERITWPLPDGTVRSGAD
jgi:hypothetical protein